MELNTLVKNNKKKSELEEVLDLEKEKLLQEVIRAKNLDQAWQSKVLRVVKCRYTEDFQKEVLKL